MHQFFLNTWIVFGENWLKNLNFYIAMPCLFFSVFLISLGIAELYGQMRIKLLKKHI